MIFGILLVYYEQYHATSVVQFQDLLNQLNPINKLVVVTNNPQLRQSNPSYILGDDLNSEFSGYDAGLRQLGKLAAEDCVVFANDTFCHHRSWDKFEKRIFASAFRKVIANQKQCMIGEVNTFKKNFSLMGMQAYEWVSTYLFCISSEFIDALNYKLCINPDTLSKLVSLDAHESIQWSEDLSDNLRLQLSQWLAVDNKYGWYNKDATMIRKCNKAKSILNEFYLSAVAKKYGYDLVDVYKNRNLLDRTILYWKRFTRHVKLRYGL
jgi:hypothetical protein